MPSALLLPPSAIIIPKPLRRLHDGLSDGFLQLAEGLHLLFRVAFIMPDDITPNGYHLGDSQLEAFSSITILGSRKSAMRHAVAILHGTTLTIEDTIGLLQRFGCQRMCR